MAYDAKLGFNKRVNLLNAGVTIYVSRNGSRIGRLEIGKGGIRWLGRMKRKHGPNLSWQKFIKRLEA
jgi:hypothetical protein